MPKWIRGVSIWAIGFQVELPGARVAAVLHAIRGPPPLLFCPPAMTISPFGRVVSPQPLYRITSFVYTTSLHVLLLTLYVNIPACVVPAGGPTPLVMPHAATTVPFGVAVIRPLLARSGLLAR